MFCIFLLIERENITLLFKMILKAGIYEGIAEVSYTLKWATR